MIGRIKRRLALYRRRGFIRSLRGGIDVFALSAIRPLFGFHTWHARSPTSLRPYRTGLAKMASDLRPDTVVEVGCGLGAILARIDAPHRIGYDVDAGVICAARRLRSRTIAFHVGGFDAVEERAIDLLIAVNWPHDFPPEQIENWIAPLLSRTRYLLVDRIDPASPLRYPYFHDFAFLAGRAAPVRIETLGEDHRTFILFEVAR